LTLPQKNPKLRLTHILVKTSHERNRAMNTKSSHTNDNQLIISYELLTLFKWLLEHEEDDLKQLISHALTGGLKKELEKITTVDYFDLEEVKHKIDDFFCLLETLLLKTLDSHTMQKAEEINLKSSVDQIDTHEYDTETVISSVEKVTAQPEAHINPQELLYKELLKRWKPNKSHLIN
jgi:hypothetical protein